MNGLENNEQGLVFACLAPHAWLLVPLVGNVSGKLAQATRTAMEEMGLRLAETQPETLILITPHGLQVEQTIPLLDSSRVQGGVGRGGLVSMGGTTHGFLLTFTVDRALNAAIVEAGHLCGVPVVRVHYPLEWMELELDFGSANPLWFLGAMVVPQPQVVVVSVGPWLTREQCLRLGQCIRQAVSGLGRRVALIASADMAHTFDADSHFGFDPAAQECDERMIRAVREHQLERLLDLDPVLVSRAKTEALEPLLVLHGATQGLALRSEVLSYEVPTYFGMLCASYNVSSE